VTDDERQRRRDVLMLLAAARRRRRAARTPVIRPDVVPPAPRDPEDDTHTHAS
jgi:hypothetical protein